MAYCFMSMLEGKGIGGFIVTKVAIASNPFLGVNLN